MQEVCMYEDTGGYTVQGHNHIVLQYINALETQTDNEK